MTEPDAFFIEYNSDDSGRQWETRWLCIPPEDGTLFRITREEWNEDRTVRRIYQFTTSDA